MFCFALPQTPRDSEELQSRDCEKLMVDDCSFKSEPATESLRELVAASGWITVQPAGGCKCQEIGQARWHSISHTWHASRLMYTTWIKPRAKVLEVGARYGQTSCTISQAELNRVPGG
eukprot:Skav227133  [mRNA]  locus=scaffold133:228701:229955:- [translate_table: standard]